MFDVRNPLAPIVVGSGLIITVNVGNILLAGVPTTIPSTVISLTQSATNYVHVTSGGVVAVNTSSFPTTSLPIAQIVCSQTSITSIIDSRPDFILPGGNSATAATMFFPYGGSASESFAVSIGTANKVLLNGFYTPTSITFSKIAVLVGIADAVNSYDWGIYDSSGSLKAHVGARTVPATGVVDLSVIGAPISLTSGKYYFSVTGNSTNLNLGIAAGSNIGNSTFLNLTASTTTTVGGVLPASCVVPADSLAMGTAVTLFSFILH